MTTLVLVHSPLVGPTTWRWVGEVLTAAGHEVVVPSLLGFEQTGPPYWSRCVEMVPDVTNPVLVGHSGAGLLLPALAERLDAPQVVFMEAALAPVSGSVPIAPGRLVEMVAPMAQDGRLPRWSEWWGPGAMEALVPDPERRAVIEGELPRLPLDYFDEEVPVPDGWADRDCSYIWFSDAYRSDADEAARRGWPVLHLPGGHLHMAVDSEAVAEILIEAATR